MIKAKEFWNFLCEEMDYRLFSGVPCLDFKPLYDKMSSKFMHYIPAVNEYSAFGIAIGTAVPGIKAGVLIDYDYLNVIDDWLEFCANNKTHLLIITNQVIKRKIPYLEFDGDYGKLKLFLGKHKNRGVAVIVLRGKDLK